MGYKDDLRIDEYNLDEECLRQPVLFEYYSQKLTPLYKLRDELKLMSEQTYARLDGITRGSASAEGKKITETTILNEITRNVQYQDLQQKYLKVCAEIKESEVIKEAFQQRRDMLKLLTELYIAGYWSSVEVKVVKKQGTEALKSKLEQKLAEDRIENRISQK